MEVTECHGHPSLTLEPCAKGPGQAETQEHPHRKGLSVPQADSAHRTHTHLDHVLDAAVGMLFDHRLNPNQGLDLSGERMWHSYLVILQSLVSQRGAGGPAASTGVSSTHCCLGLSEEPTVTQVRPEHRGPGSRKMPRASMRGGGSGGGPGWGERKETKMQSPSRALLVRLRGRGSGAKGPWTLTKPGSSNPGFLEPGQPLSPPWVSRHGRETHPG